MIWGKDHLMKEACSYAAVSELWKVLVICVVKYYVLLENQTT